MKYVKEKLKICEYDYPFADSLNPTLHKIICNLPDGQNRRTSLQSKMTSWNTDVKEFKLIINLVSQLLHRDFIESQNKKVKCSEGFIIFVVCALGHLSDVTGLVYS